MPFGVVTKSICLLFSRWHAHPTDNLDATRYKYM